MVVVLPASMWATIPMLRMFDSSELMGGYYTIPGADASTSGRGLAQLACGGRSKTSGSPCETAFRKTRACEKERKPGNEKELISLAKPRLLLVLLHKRYLP